MSAILTPSPAFARSHEPASLFDAADAQEWTPTMPPVVTETEVEQFIAELAASGVIEDELGCAKQAPSIFRAVARQWVLDREAVGEIIGPVFWKWAQSALLLAKRGK